MNKPRRASSNVIPFLDPDIEFHSQRVASGIEAQLSQIFTGIRLRSVTRERLRAVRGDMVKFLERLQEGGDIPDDVNIEFTQAVIEDPDLDPCKIDVQLPVSLRLYIQDGAKSVRTKRFQHDSDCCRFLGHGLGHDLYYCHQHSLPTVIARHSSVPSDYESGMAAAKLVPHTEPLGLALALAAEADLIGSVAIALMSR